MFERIRWMFFKEVIQIFRDPQMWLVLFFFPLVEAIIFGYALTLDVRDIPTAIYDLDKTVASRNFISAFTHSGYFDVVKQVENGNEIQQLLDKGVARASFQIDHGFQANLLKGISAPVQVLVDGADANSAMIVQSYVARIAAEFSLQDVLDPLHQKPAPPVPRIEVVSRAWYNPNLDSHNFFVPAVVGSTVTLITLILTSMAIVREKEMGTMEQIIVTPITPLEFILGKVFPFILIVFIDVVIILPFSVYLFDVPFNGSVILLFVCIMIFSLTSLGIGLFISTISRTQQQALMSASLFLFPELLLSGFAFPISSMPDIIQKLTYLNPLRYFLEIIRGIFLKGVGVEVLWPQMVILSLMGVIVLWLAVSRFRKTMV